MCSRLMEALSYPVLLVAAGGCGYGGAEAAVAGAPAVHILHSLQLINLVPIKVSHASSQLLLPDQRLSLLPPYWNHLALALEGNEEINSLSGSQVAAEVDPGGLLQQASSPVAEVMKLLSSSPMLGPRFGEFVLVSVSLILLFWVGNYIVPDIIFAKVFQQKEEKDQNSSAKNDEALESLVDGTDGSNSVLATNSKASKSVGTSSRTLQADTSKRDRTLGFGNPTKQTGKSRKGKA